MLVRGLSDKAVREVALPCPGRTPGLLLLCAGTFAMDPSQLYDPPPSRSAPSRARSSSFSATPRVFQADTTRRQSFSALSAPGRSTVPVGSLSDDDAETRSPPIELTSNPTRSRSASFGSASAQDPADAAADRALWRDGRQSKQQMLDDDPKLRMTGDFEQFMAQVRRSGADAMVEDLVDSPV